MELVSQESGVEQKEEKSGIPKSDVTCGYIGFRECLQDDSPQNVLCKNLSRRVCVE